MTISIACAACRAPNERGARFCRRCGTPLTQDVAPPPVAIACPTCGQPVTGSQKFCRGCGHPLAEVTLESQSAARSELPSAPAAQATAEAPPAPSRMPASESSVSATHRMPPRHPELPMGSSRKSTAPNTRRRKVLPWAVGVGLLVAVGIAGGLVYTGKLTLPLVAQRLVQDYVPVHAPEFQVGDNSSYEWSFTQVDGGVNTYLVTHKVIDIQSDQVTMEIATPHAKFRRQVYNRQMNIAEDSHDLQTFNPPLRNYDFPLLPGKSWNATSTLTSKDHGEEVEIGRITVSGEVLGWEHGIGRLNGVIVDGLKLKIKTVIEPTEPSRVTNEPSVSTRMQWRTEWYVPSAGRSVVARESSDWLDYKKTIRLVNFIPSKSSDTE
ncbi:MAG: zinc ribbon domain-containing protein [Thermomonas sp.]|uniref:zinc ribbon domain-containing protein n=1 Tax=Thermomonas sp. TaxID=1971895 RepID=UPI001B68A329|nr:zinc ribbon domain-containing protein [Thermomonas sp.]MBP8647671.1 zinc ribbon domain-containing protein [Thermomonas sp.]